MENEIPNTLYKILPYDKNTFNLNIDKLPFSENDTKFIHMSTERQLQSTIEKFFASDDSYVVYELDSSKLIGRVELEYNSKRTDKYYHIYDGYIPSIAIITYKIVNPYVSKD